MFTRRPALADPQAFGGAGIVAADGTPQPTILDDPRDIRFRWASSIDLATSDGFGPDPMAWIVMSSKRPVGARDQSAAPQLWLFAWFPGRGAATPFHLPGQDPTAAVRHAPQRIARAAP